MSLLKIHLWLAVLLVSSTALLRGQVSLGNDALACGNFTVGAGPGFVSYLWSTGDTVKTINITTTGTYWVEVTDTSNQTFSDTIIVVVVPEPDAVFVVPNGCIEDTIVFDEQSSNLSQFGTSWFWEFGDGDTSNAISPDHIYQSPGTYTVKLYVTNEGTCTDSMIRQVTIFDRTTVTVSNDTTVNIGENAPLAVTNLANTDYLWEPNFFLSDDTIPFPVSTPSVDIEYVVTVVDGNGCVYMDTVNVEVNYSPTAANDTKNADPNRTTNIFPSQNDSDPDRDVLMISIVDSALHGSVMVSGDTVIYTPDANYSGPDTVRYQVCDEGVPPLCDTATIFINVSNIRPTAVDDEDSTRVAVDVTLNVLDNDVDLNEQILTVVQISSPSNGSINDLGFGLLIYTPYVGFSGVDSFYYIICDNGTPSLCDTGWVYVTVVDESIFVNNTISPNGNGLYDTFIIEGIQNYPRNTLKIFSRWGEIVFEQQGYANDWDGQQGFSEPVPEGTYFYHLDLGNNSDPHTGWLYIVR